MSRETGFAGLFVPVGWCRGVGWFVCLPPISLPTYLPTYQPTNPTHLSNLPPWQPGYITCMGIGEQPWLTYLPTDQLRYWDYALHTGQNRRISTYGEDGFPGSRSAVRGPRFVSWHGMMT
jgi:hypothetical protein